MHAAIHDPRGAGSHMQNRLHFSNKQEQTPAAKPRYQQFLTPGKNTRDRDQTSYFLLASLSFFLTSTTTTTNPNCNLLNHHTLNSSLLNLKTIKLKPKRKKKPNSRTHKHRVAHFHSESSGRKHTKNTHDLDHHRHHRPSPHTTLSLQRQGYRHPSLTGIRLST
jgi:hypothetical protein